MRISILTGLPLPESLAEFDQIAAEGKLRYRACQECGDDFTPRTVHTKQGWAETQISGICENCFDELFREPDEIIDDDDD